MTGSENPQVGVIMGSQSDWSTMQAAAQVLQEFGVPLECRVVSAHRTPRWMCEYAGTAQQRGLKIIIAGAGGAAHLPDRGHAGPYGGVSARLGRCGYFARH